MFHTTEICHKLFVNFLRGFSRQTFMNCLERSLEKCAGGDWLEDYSYVVLEHGMMDKKCGVCPNHNYANLEQALRGKRHHQAFTGPLQKIHPALLNLGPFSRLTKFNSSFASLPIQVYFSLLLPFS